MLAVVNVACGGVRLAWVLRVHPDAQTISATITSGWTYWGRLHVIVNLFDFYAGSTWREDAGFTSRIGEIGYAFMNSSFGADRYFAQMNKGMTAIAVANSLSN